MGNMYKSWHLANQAACSLITKSAKYRYICIEVGGYGKQNDAGIFESSNLEHRITTGTGNIPTFENLPNRTVKIPFVVLGIEAYPLLPYLMKPFTRVGDYPADKKRFNEQLSRAQQTV